MHHEIQNSSRLRPLKTPSWATCSPVLHNPMLHSWRRFCCWIGFYRTRQRNPRHISFGRLQATMLWRHQLVPTVQKTLYRDIQYTFPTLNFVRMYQDWSNKAKPSSKLLCTYSHFTNTKVCLTEASIDLFHLAKVIEHLITGHQNTGHNGRTVMSGASAPCNHVLVSTNLPKEESY